MKDKIKVAICKIKQRYLKLIQPIRSYREFFRWMTSILCLIPIKQVYFKRITKEIPKGSGKTWNKKEHGKGEHLLRPLTDLWETLWAWKICCYSHPQQPSREILKLCHFPAFRSFRFLFHWDTYSGLNTSKKKLPGIKHYKNEDKLDKKRK